MRVASAIAFSDEARLRLENRARERSTPVRIVQRSRIVLLAGDGLQNKQIAERMEIAPRMVALWRSRFPPLGVAEVSAYDRSDRTRWQRNLSDLRQLLDAQT